MILFYIYYTELIQIASLFSFKSQKLQEASFSYLWYMYIYIYTCVQMQEENIASQCKNLNRQQIQ